MNLATGAGGHRTQTGSAFKPFALVTAFENGISPGHVFPRAGHDQHPDRQPPVWRVTNAEGSGYGSMSLREATVDSVNTVYAQLIEQLGPEKSSRRRAGWGSAVATGSVEPTHAARADLLGGARYQRGRTHWRWPPPTARSPRGGQHVAPVPGHEHHRPSGRRAVGRPTRARSSTRGRHGGRRHLAGGRPVRDRRGRRHRTTQIGKTAPATTTRTRGSSGRSPSSWRRSGSDSSRASRWSRRGPRITVFGGTWPAQIWRLFMLESSAELPVQRFPNSPVVDYSRSPST